MNQLAAQLAGSLKPTQEQQRIIQAIPRAESQLIQAYAGTAKTTTLVMAAQQVKHPALALAFNKKIAQELQAKLPRSFTVKTLNALGFAAWRATRSRCEVSPELRSKLVTEACKSAGLRDQGAWAKVRQLVTELQSLGAAPPNMTSAEPLVQLTKDLWLQLAFKCWIEREELPAYGEAALEVLAQAIASAKAGVLTSFDDQIYMPLVFGGQWPKFGLIFGDEVQDWNGLNHEMVKRCLRPGGKLVLAGDSRQSLYAFRGALSDSMERARVLAPQWLDQQLTLTFRCPQAVVERQQAHAPSYAAAPNNKKGQVLQWGNNAIEVIDENWYWQQFEALFKPAALPAAVLCRNNAPLLRLCLQLLRRGIRTSFLGKDLGKSLLTLAKKVCGKAQGKELLQRKVELWQEKELQGLDPGANADAIHDRADCLLAVLETPGIDSGEALAKALEQLLAQEGACQLASIHKAKGLEWEVVMLLDPWRMPRKGARGAELQSEMNCKYVAETRTRDVLVLANLADLTWEPA